MTDIDFDELDRAVNTILQSKGSNAQKNKPETSQLESAKPDLDEEGLQANQPQPVVNTPPDTIKNEPPKEADVVSQLPSANSEPVDVVSKKLEIKPRGRFMDVMPSSVKPKQPVVVPKLAPRKEFTVSPGVGREETAGTVEPIVASSHIPRASEPVKPVSPTTSTPNSSEDISTGAELTTSEWPDPVDIVYQAEQAKDQPSGESEEQFVEPTPVDNEPLTSPFLPDAKVDKRPHGGPSKADQPSSGSTTDEGIAPVDNFVSDEQAVSEIVSLPEELQSDVLALESTMTQAKSDNQSSEPDNNSSAVTKPHEKRVVDQPVAVQPQSLTALSLPQQPPKQLDSDQSDVEPDNSIFDSEHYQAPVKHPVKRKNGWFGVIAIVALVLLGTLGGIGFYLFSSGY